MKTLILSVVFLFGASLNPLLQAGEDDKKFGDTCFVAYQGPQKAWPVAESAQVIQEHAVPIYIGLPNKKYTILGRIYDPRTGGIGIIGRGLAEGLFSERDRQRDCANQARYRGGTAVLVTNNKDIIKAFDLSKEDLEKTTPLFNHKDKIVLAIKFETDVARGK